MTKANFRINSSKFTMSQDLDSISTFNKEIIKIKETKLKYTHIGTHVLVCTHRFKKHIHPAMEASESARHSNYFLLGPFKKITLLEKLLGRVVHFRHLPKVSNMIFVLGLKLSISLHLQHFLLQIYLLICFCLYFKHSLLAILQLRSCSFPHTLQYQLKTLTQGFFELP